MQDCEFNFLLGIKVLRICMHTRLLWQWNRRPDWLKMSFVVRHLGTVLKPIKRGDTEVQLCSRNREPPQDSTPSINFKYKSRLKRHV